MKVARIAVVILAGAVGGMLSPALGQVVRPDPNKTKSSESLRSIFKEVVGPADKCTVIVQGADTPKGRMTQVALGTIVAADGFILTKASEVVGRDVLKVTLNGKSLEAKVVGVSEPQDLAMLKVEAKGLNAVTWADLKKEKVEVGEWVASAGTGAGGGGSGQPIAVG
jgi:serine protease Do